MNIVSQNLLIDFYLMVFYQLRLFDCYVQVMKQDQQQICRLLSMNVCSHLRPFNILKLNTAPFFKHSHSNPIYPL